jgi:hypothetical protein
MRHNLDKDPPSGTNSLGPGVFNCAVGAAIEISVMGEMVEPLARAIETGGDKVAAVVSCAPIRLASIGLRAPRSGLHVQSYLTGNDPRPSMGID